MKKTTNIYILADTSYTMTRHRERLAATLTKMSRALGFAPEQTRSIFLLFSAYRVLDEWQKPLDELFRLREFALSHRYVISYTIVCRSLAVRYSRKQHHSFHKIR